FLYRPRLPTPPPLIPYTTLFRSFPAVENLQAALAQLKFARCPHSLTASLAVRQVPDRSSHSLHCRRSQNLPSSETLPKIARSMKDRKSTRLNSSHVAISYAVFCL